MTGTAANDATPLRASSQTAQQTAPQATCKAVKLVSRKIWLPKLLYAAVPYFYIASGLAAFLATIYISEWFWILPQYLLFSAVCLHLGISVYRRRMKSLASTNEQG
jgi:hypothetical protein